MLSFFFGSSSKQKFAFLVAHFSQAGNTGAVFMSIKYFVQFEVFPSGFDFNSRLVCIFFLSKVNNFNVIGFLYVSARDTDFNRGN